MHITRKAYERVVKVFGEEMPYERVVIALSSGYRRYRTRAIVEIILSLERQMKQFGDDHQYEVDTLRIILAARGVPQP